MTFLHFEPFHFRPRCPIFRRHSIFIFRHAIFRRYFHAISASLLPQIFDYRRHRHWILLILSYAIFVAIFAVFFAFAITTAIIHEPIFLCRRFAFDILLAFSLPPITPLPPSIHFISFSPGHYWLYCHYSARFHSFMLPSTPISPIARRRADYFIFLRRRLSPLFSAAFIAAFITLRCQMPFRHARRLSLHSDSRHIDIAYWFSLSSL